jgi:hypothetical protein
MTPGRGLIGRGALLRCGSSLTLDHYEARLEARRDDHL